MSEFGSNWGEFSRRFAYYFGVLRSILKSTIAGYLFVAQFGCFVFDSFVEDTSCLSLRNARTEQCLLPQQIAAGQEHNCVVLKNGQVMCWGGNLRSQLGLKRDIEVDAIHIPQTAQLDAPASYVATGAFHTCALSGASVYCWGANDSGQAGVPVTADRGRTVFTPKKLEDLPNINWKMLAAGEAHTCALSESSDGFSSEVWCWGDNKKGQINGQDPASSLPYPKKIELGERLIEKISAGATHTCAATSTNIYCWGDPQFGKTGRDDATQTPRQLRPGWQLDQIILDVEAGREHNCALIEGGDIYCWGNGTGSRFLAQNVETATTVEPVLVAGAVGAEQLPPMQIVQAGQRHTCTLSVRNDNGRVFCWGGNEDYQLGDGTNQSRHSPAEVANASQQSSVEQLAVGGKHACALKRKSREIVCWGLNENGQSGQPFEEGKVGSQRSVKQPEPFTLPDPEDPNAPEDDAGVTVPTATDAGFSADGSVGNQDASGQSQDAATSDAMTESPDAGSMLPDTGAMQCAEDNDCQSAGFLMAPFCVGGVCVECRNEGHCPVGQVCQMNMCQSVVTDAGVGDSGLYDGGASQSPSRVLKKMAVGVDHNCVVTQQGQGPEDVHCWGALYSPYGLDYEMTQRESVKINTSVVGPGEEIHEIAAGDGVACFTTNSNSPMNSGNRSVDQRMYCFGNPQTGIMQDATDEWGEDGYGFSHFAESNSPTGFGNIVMDVVAKPNGDHFVTGFLSGVVPLGGNCGIVPSVGAGSDGYLAKYDALGQCRWVKRFYTESTQGMPETCHSDSRQERGNKLVLHNGIVYVAGSLVGCNYGGGTGTMLSHNQAVFEGAAGPFPYNNAAAAGFVVGYADNGAFQHVQLFKTEKTNLTMAPNPSSSLSDMVMDQTNGRLYVVGRVQEKFENAGFTITATTGAATFVAVLNEQLQPAAGSTGNSVVKLSRAWAFTAASTGGGVTSPFPINYDAIALDNAGRLVIAGTYWGELFDASGRNLVDNPLTAFGISLARLRYPISSASGPEIDTASGSVTTFPVYQIFGNPVSPMAQVTSLTIDMQNNPIIGGFWRGELMINRLQAGTVNPQTHGPFRHGETYMRAFLFSVRGDAGFTSQGAYNGQRYFISSYADGPSLVRKLEVDSQEGRLVSLLEYKGEITLPLGRTGTEAHTSNDTDALMCFHSLRDGVPVHCEKFQSPGDGVLTSFARKPDASNVNSPTHEYFLTGAYNWNPDPLGGNPPQTLFPFSSGFATHAAGKSNAGLVGVTTVPTPKQASLVAQKIDLGPVLSAVSTSTAPPIKMRLGGGHVCVEVEDGIVIDGSSMNSRQEECAACGISAERKLWCWGRNDQRQSVSNETERLSPVGGNSRCGVEVMNEPMPIDVSNTNASVTGGACPLQVPYSIDELVLGRNHACTRIQHPQYPNNPDQALACWGEQSLNQAGQDTTSPAAANSTYYRGNSQIPLLMPNSSAAEYVLGSGPASDHTCLVKDGTEMVCWGRYYEGQLSPVAWPNNGMSGAAEPYPEIFEPIESEFYLANIRSSLPNFQSDPYVSQISTGAAHTCFVVSALQSPASAVVCFGANDRGQSGHTSGNFGTSNLSFVGKSASSAESYGILNTVTGTTTQSNTPAFLNFNQSNGTKQVLDLQLGRNHSCAMVEDTSTQERTMYCWGDNQKSQLQLESNRQQSYSVGAYEMTLP